MLKSGPSFLAQSSSCRELYLLTIQLSQVFTWPLQIDYLAAISKYLILRFETQRASVSVIFKTPLGKEEELSSFLIWQILSSE